MLFGNGATFADLGTPEAETTFQECLIRTQMHLEDTFQRLAEVRLARPTSSPRRRPAHFWRCVTRWPRLAGADGWQTGGAALRPRRGASAPPGAPLAPRRRDADGVTGRASQMDGSAYIGKEQWEALTNRIGADSVSLRDARYHAVFHLVTAAKGANQYYTLETNVTRTETVEEACALDDKTLRAWVGHPRLKVFDNDGVGFERKLQHVVDAAARFVGLPVSARDFRRFLLGARPALDDFPVHVERFEVEKVYLLSAADSSTDYTFVRRRTQGELSTYGQTTARRAPTGEQVEVKRIITSREYAYAVSQRADKSRHVVRMERASFLWEGQYFEVYLYDEPLHGLCLLNCQARDGDDSVSLPPFLDVSEEVTGRPEYSAYTVSVKETLPDHPRAETLAQLMRLTPDLRRTVSAAGEGDGEDQDSTSPEPLSLSRQPSDAPVEPADSAPCVDARAPTTQGVGQ